jgi:poly(A) polymerase
MENLKKLDELNRTNPQARLGKKLYFIIYDFITTLTDWKKETEGKYSASELYAKTWTECRNYVLTMNPQRRELEYAVKSVMNSLGVQIRVQPKKS